MSLQYSNRLSAQERQEVAAVILRHTLQIDLPLLDDKELILNVEEILLELDRKEMEDGTA